MVKIYSKQGCVSCETAKAYCLANGIEHQVLILSRDYQLNEFMKIGQGKWKSFPLITYNDEFVGDLESLKNILK